MKLIATLRDNIRKRLSPLETALDGPAGQPPATIFTKRNVLLILSVWFLFWAVLPILCVGNVYIDISENIEWGRHFQFGYDKNPYVGAWLTYWAYRLAGRCPEIAYILSQVFIAAAVWSLFALSSDIFGKEEGWKRAVPAVFAVLMVPFASIWSGEFNDDIMDFGFWSLLTLFFFRAMRTQAWKWWILTGLTAGLAFMTKYLAAVLFLAFLVPLFFSSEGRRSWRNPAFYAAVATGFLLSLPNFIWLFGNDGVALQYAWERTHAEKAGFGDHFKEPASFLLNGVPLFLIPLSAYVICFVRRTASSEDNGGRFAVLFLTSVTAVPFLFLFVLSVISGAEIGLPWTTPLYVFPFLLMTALLPPKNGIRREKLFLLFFLITVSAFLAYHLNAYLYRRGYIRSSTGYESYPGRESAEDLTREWHRRYGTKLRFVVGERTEACNTALFSPDHPEPFFSANPLYSQWIRPEDIRKYGALIVWQDRKTPPAWTSSLPGKVQCQGSKEYHRAVVPWFRKLAGDPKTVRIWYGFLPPSPDEPQE